MCVRKVAASQRHEPGTLAALVVEAKMLLGEPPTIAFSWDGGERIEGDITSLSADSVTIDFGDDSMTAARQSGSPSCE